MVSRFFLSERGWPIGAYQAEARVVIGTSGPNRRRLRSGSPYHCIIIAAAPLSKAIASIGSGSGTARRLSSLVPQGVTRVSASERGPQSLKGRDPVPV
jgi:hypothetical protein